MTMRVLGIALLVIAIALPALPQTCSGCGRFNEQCRLITSPCTRFPLTAEESVLDGLFATGRPVVVYVHGRGREPGKTLREDIVGRLEREYGVGVLMFNWDSGFPLIFPLRRPVGSAVASGPSLRDAITALIRYRETHPDTARTAVSLLVHSMGSITLRSALEGLSLRTTRGPLFANILITGSDEDAAGHHTWVERLEAQHAIVIAINRNDATLALARDRRSRNQVPLGRNLVPPLAANATYLETTGLVGGSHRMFEKGRQHRNVAICRIFTSLLRGEAPDLQPGVLIPNATADGAHPCFRGVIDSPDADDD